MSETDWLDPRPRGAAHPLAARSARAKRRKLVLLDNGKLAPPYDRWLPIRDALLAELRRLGEVVLEHCDLLADPVATHAPRVERWRAAGVEGVVFGLCDAGVTQPTVMHAAAAERAGIPAAVVCTGQVIELAATAASFLVPGLPLVCLEVSRLDGAEELAAIVQRAGPDLAEALSANSETLQAKARARFPFVASLARSEAPAAQPFQEYAARNAMTDGLPVLTPSIARVRAMLDAAGRDADAVLIEAVSPSGAPLTLGQAAICSVMAGCAPERFPLVVAALGAMAEPAYRLELGTITTHPSAHVLLFSGPAAQEAGLASGRGCLGPGHEANATIGRAVSLTLLNSSRAIPGRSALCLIGSPAQFGCCFADRSDGDSPFPPLASVLAGPGESIVWAQKTETPHNVMDHLSSTPESLLDSIAGVAATLGGNASYVPSDMLLILNPEHAEILLRAGWTRADAQRYLWERARNPRARLVGRGVKPDWPTAWQGWEHIPVAPAPENIWIAIAGAPGPQSMVTVAWGYSHAVWRRIPGA